MKPGRAIGISHPINGKKRRLATVDAATEVYVLHVFAAPCSTVSLSLPSFCFVNNSSSCLDFLSGFCRRIAWYAFKELWAPAKKTALRSLLLSGFFMMND